MATDRAHWLPILELGFALPDSINGVIGAIRRIWLSADSRLRVAGQVDEQRGAVT
jgi:hypothetical protein